MLKRTNRNLLLAIFAGVITCEIVTMPVFAQEDTLTIEEVIVTARKREENLQDTPISITAFTGAELESRGSLDLADVGNNSPNVQFVNGSSLAGNSNSANIYIRGIGSSAFLINNDPGVGVYVDDVYVARNVGAVLDLSDVDRVEILRGPQGTLFGRNTNGGAVSIYSKQPDSEFSAMATVTVGQDHHYGFRGSVNLPLSDQVFARISALYRHRDGYVKALQYDDSDLGDDNVAAIRGQLRFEPTDDLDVTIAADYTRERENGGPWVARAIDGTQLFTRFANVNTGDATCLTAAGQSNNPACLGPVQLAGNFATNNTFYDHNTGQRIKPFSNLDVFGISGVINWDMGSAHVKSITAYRDLDSDFIRSITHGPQLVFENPNTLYESKTFTQEIQLTGSGFDNKLDWVTGIFYYREDARQRPVGVHSIFILTGQIPVTPDDRKLKNESAAVFSQATWHVTDRLHLTGGLRYTDESKNIDLTYYVPGTATVSLATLGELETSELTPHASASYDFTDDVLGYFSYSEGFRSGTFTTRLAFDVDVITSAPVAEPEYVTTYEVGVKSTLFDGRVRLNLSAFHTIFDDMQVEYKPGPPFSPSSQHIGNVAAAEVNGFEAELMALLTQNLTLTANLGLLDSKYTEATETSAITIDNDLAYSPDYQANVGLEYTWPLTGIGGQVVGRLDWAFNGAQALAAVNVNDPLVRTDAWNRGDLNITYISADGRWDVSLKVKNLTDQAYVTSAYNGINPFGVAEVIYNRPRQVFGAFTRRF